MPTPQPLTSQPLEAEACCFKPSEIIRYQDKKVAECSKGVEVIRHQNTCTDCAYPVVVRSPASAAVLIQRNARSKCDAIQIIFTSCGD